MKFYGLKVLAALGAALVLSLCCLAQSDTASISGFVRDPSGSVVPNASVVVKHEVSGYERRSTTNESGYYVVTTLPPGYYTVSVEAPGFKKFEKTRNKLDSNISTTVDAALQVGAVTETVEVVAQVASVQSETATLGKLVTQEQLKMMQLNGRNPLFLALLKPGVSGGSLAGFSFTMTTGGLNINGSRTQDNLITFDGAVAVRTRSNGTSIGAVDADSVAEVQIMTANYSPEYGRSAGGQIRIVTRSGSRDFHGDFYEYVRNSAMNANTWARNRTIGRPDISGQPEPFRFNQYGYNVSGPAYIPGKWNTDRNKLFWLWGQEWAKFHRNQTTIITVPTARMQTGDFSELLDPRNTFFGRTTVVNDPDTRQPFANNVIPASRASRNGLGLLRAYPLPVPGFLQGTSNYIQSRGAFQDQRKDTVSIDFNPSDRHQFRFRHLNYRLVDAGAFRGGTDRAPSTLTRPNRTASLNWVWTKSPTLVHELLLTASVDRVYIAVQTEGDRYRRSIYGINYPYIFQEKEIFDKVPTIEMQNFASIDGGPYPSSSTGPIYNLYDNITKIKGTHTLKFGFAFERAGQNDFDQINVSGVPGGTNNQNGRFVFDNTRAGAPTTGLAIGNAAMGLYTSYAELGERSFTPYRGHTYEWFAQDSWKATQKLRLEFGLRHTIIQPYYSLWRNMLVFDPAAYDPSKAAVLDPRNGFVLSGDQYNGMVIPGDGWPDAAKGRVRIADTGEFNRLFRGVGKSFSNIHFKDFQPRMGIAYALNPTTVIRGGAGRFITRLGVSDSVFLGGNPPLQPTISTTNSLVDSPGGAGRLNFPLIVTTQDRIFPNPDAWAWNVTVEKQIANHTVVEVGYVGRRGLHQQREKNINQLQPGTIQANPGINPDFLRPYKGFGFIRSTNNEASSRYNGLQVGVTRRFTNSLSYGVAYTLSKTSDNGSAQRDIIPNAFDASNLYGPASYDRRHVLILNWIYELPLLRGNKNLAGRVLGGWQIAGVTQFQTGTRFSIGTGDDFAGVGTGSGSQFWRKNGDPKLPHGERKFSEATADQNFFFRPRNSDGTAIFTEPTRGTFVTDSLRNILYGPGLQNWTLGVFKNFLLSEERHRLTFRWELYNWPNHPNWDGPSTNPRAATFGKVTGKNFERTMQLSLRYSF